MHSSGLYYYSQTLHELVSRLQDLSRIQESVLFLDLSTLAGVVSGAFSMLVWPCLRHRGLCLLLDLSRQQEPLLLLGLSTSRGLSCT